MSTKHIIKDLGIMEDFFGDIVCKKILKKIFGHRFYTLKPLGFEVSEFKDLHRERHTFKNVENDTLVGYMYSNQKVEKKYLMVFSHGFGGGGHNTYLDLIEYFTRQGFYVFAYDATANDESEGKGLKGFTQGLLDADKAISYVESLKEYKSFPLYQCGHSWGAYSSSNALHLHPRTKGLIAFSGFNNCISIIKANGDMFTGNDSEDTVKHFIEIERHHFGKIADSTAIESFEKSEAKIAIIHSNDDRTVPPLAGIEQYKKHFGDDPRFLFVDLEKKGHGTVYYSKEGKEYFDSVLKQYYQKIKLNKWNDKQKEDYLYSLINRDKWLSLIDECLLDRILDFIL